ncbi:Asp/Glu racemase [Yinghuangia sp. KLBMP8922]|uniref:Maleate isomerase n=2 Tax=Yinghuangia soli TaxID=2908204 RepID=A0AA41PYD3_9ACTN|nr:Asp/Glu racemase [Yinghuangia soli]MCF2527951.1 Asp/Glu racemase [Yinghuangia soli]
METELPRMMRAREALFPDERFVFHSSRMRMKHVTPEELRGMNAQTRRAAAELADARPDAVATACLVAIMAQGPGYHCTAEDEITGVLREEGVAAPVVSSAGALITGIKALGARRVAIVTPYMKPLTALVAEYLEDAGTEVVDTLSLEVPDNIAVARLDPRDLLGHVGKLDLSRADALVLSACVQMPSLPVLPEVQEAVGMPVLSAAAATAYCLLAELGLETAVPGAGELLTGRYPVPAGA